MRPQTGPESTLLAGNNYAIFHRTKVANGSGTLVDLSDWVERIVIDDEIDQPTRQATVEFTRSSSATLSLVPFRTDSTLNRLDDGTTYAPLLDSNRLITIEVATVAIGATPISSDWKEIFRGYLGPIESSGSPVSVVAYDEGIKLVKGWIKTVATYGYDEPLETVMQQILTNSFGNFVYTLTVEGTPAFVIRAYEQQSEPVMSALQALAQERGWDFRYKWNVAAGEFQPTLYEIPRSKTVPDRTWGPATYYAVSRMEVSDQDVRNYITASWRDAEANGGPRKDTTVTDPASILRYGEQFFGIVLGDDSTVDTAAEVSALLDAALLDLKDPKADFGIEGQFFWPAELGDLYRFSPNDVHFNTDQDWAVTNARHELYGGTGRTYLQVRGKPSGGFLTWMMLGKGLRPPNRPLFDRILNFREIARTATTITQGWEPETVPLEYWVWMTTLAQPVSGDPFATLIGAPQVRLTGETTSYTVAIPRTGYITYVRIAAVFDNARLGSPWDFTVQPNDATPAITEPWQTQAAGGLTSDVTFTVTDPANLGGTLSVWTNHDSADDADSTGAVEGTVAIASTPATVNNATSFSLTVGGTSALLDDIKVHAGKGKRIFAKFVNSQGVSSDVTPILLKPGKPPVNAEGVLTPGVITDVTPFASNLSPVQIVAALPGSGTITGHVVFLTTDKRLYRWTGTAWEAVVADFTGTIDTAQIADLAVTAAKLGAAAVTTAKLANLAVTDAILAAGAVTTTKITDDAVTTAKIVAGAIVTAKIAAGAVTTNEIAANTIVAGDIAAGTISATEIAAGAVIAAKIGALAVETDKLAANAVTAAKIAANTITASQIAANTITAGQIAAAAISTTELAASAVTAAKIGAGEITTDKLAANSVTAAKMSVNSLDAISANLGSITAGSITTLTAVKVLGGGSAPTLGSIHAFWTGTNEVLGTNSAGRIQLQRSTAGTSPTGVQCRVTFATAYASTPYVMLGQSALNVDLGPVVSENVTTTYFDVSFGYAVGPTGAGFFVYIVYQVVG